MSLASPTPASWMYDFGEYTNAQLTAQSAVAIDAKIATAKTQALNMISSGNYGVAGAWGTAAQGTYRVVVRADAVVPQGFTVEVRQVTT